MSIFGVILVCIFPHSDWIRRDTDWIRRDTPYLLRIQSECGKIRTRITPNTDTFYAVYDKRKCIGSIDKLNMKYFAVLLFPLVRVIFNIFCKWLSYFQFSLNKAWIYQTRVQNKPKNCCINKPINFEWDRLFFEHNQCFAFFHAFKISIIY